VIAAAVLLVRCDLDESALLNLLVVRWIRR
jgi:hypothetical protein